MYSLTSPASNLQPRFNICPTDTVDAVVDHQLAPMRWGLIPAWWGKPLKEFNLATFNARAETVTEKAIFRSAFKNSRCLIPVSGYYEWQTTPEGKQPFYFTRRDGQVFHQEHPLPALQPAPGRHLEQAESGPPMMSASGTPR